MIKDGSYNNFKKPYNKNVEPNKNQVNPHFYSVDPKTLYYPKNPKTVENMNDQQIVNLWRYLPAASNREEEYILGFICDEFDKRFRPQIWKNLVNIA